MRPVRRAATSGRARLAFPFRPGRRRPRPGAVAAAVHAPARVASRSLGEATRVQRQHTRGMDARRTGTPPRGGRTTPSGTAAAATRMAPARRAASSARTGEALLAPRPRARRTTRAAARRVCALTALLLALSCAGAPSAATLPEPVFSAVHGRVVGWARSGRDWFAVYLDRAGGGWCGLEGSSWWIALVESTAQGSRVRAARRLGAAMCGNTLAWVRAGRFSDGRQREVAFMLWQTPSIGATTYIYRIEQGGLSLLASFPGDRVTLGAGTVTVTYENSGRSPNGRLEDVYRFGHGRYRLLPGRA